MVMSIARGQAWRGREVKQGNVAYLVGEGGNRFHYRLEAYAEYHDFDLNTIPFYLLNGAPNFLEKTDVKDLITGIKALGAIDYIVVDTLAQVTPGANENSGEDMGRALAHCKALHKATGAMVLLVAHAGKDASKGIRGWSGIKGALDVEILVERSGDTRSAKITKLKDGDGEGEVFGFKLNTVNLGLNDAGKQITSCVVVDGAAPGPKTKGTREPVWQKVVLEALDELIKVQDLAGGDITHADLITEAVNQPPGGLTSDLAIRRQRIKKAITDLEAAKRISIKNDAVVKL
jgi:hypothetical protein